MIAHAHPPLTNIGDIPITYMQCKLLATNNNNNNNKQSYKANAFVIFVYSLNLYRL